VSWGGDLLVELDVPAFSHDFVLLPDDTVALIEFDRRTMESGQDVWGNRIVETDVLGSRSEIWSTFDSWEPGVDGDVDDQGYWTGVNALDYDESSDGYMLSARGLSAIVELGRDGALGEQIGGPQSDYDFLSNDDIPERQHQFERLDDGLLVFDNRDAKAGSRLLELALDTEAHTASARWTWQPAEPLFVYALGDVDRRSDGSTIAAWCTSGVIDQIGADGSLEASVALGLGAGFGFLDTRGELIGMNAASH